MKRAMLFVCLSLLAPQAFAAEAVSLTGAGATFPYPLYSKWFAEYKKANPKVEINYQSIGSGGGVKQLLEKTVDFGASDAPMTDEQLGKAQAPILHIPTVLGAVVLTYNLPELKKPLRLSGEVIADLYLGKITRWDDAKLAALNPGVQLPKGDVMIVRRSDGSGTTAVFADYLAKVSPEWKAKVGTGTALNWPVGLGGKGNEGVTGLVKQTPNSIGYVELVYAQSNQLAVAEVKNKAGQFVVPSPKSVTAAAQAAAKDMPKDFRVSITDAADKGAYPISSYTYLLTYKKFSGEKGKSFTQFLNWAMNEGQKMAEPMGYASLPKNVLSTVKAKVKEIELQ